MRDHFVKSFRYIFLKISFHKIHHGSVCLHLDEMQIARYISCISAAKVQQKNEIRKKKRKNLALFHCLMSFEIV